MRCAMTLDVVVLTANPEWFARSRACLDAQRVHYRGIVVTNDDLGPAGEGWEVIEAGADHSYARSMNRAIEKLDGASPVLHYSDDALLQPGSVGAMRASLYQAASDGAWWVGACVWHIDPPDQPCHAGVVFDGQGHHTQRLDMPTVDRPEQAVSFAAVMFLPQTFGLFGGFDEQFRYGHDDIDWQLTAFERGARRPWVAAGAKVLHDEMRTRSQVDQHENWRRLYAKWPPERIRAALEKASR